MDHLQEPYDDRAERLAKRGAEHLAAFVLKLGQTVDGVEERIETFLATDDYTAAVRLAERFMAEIMASRRFYRDFNGARELVAQLDNVLDLIETAVLPVNPSAAAGLAVQFLDCDTAVLECSSDSDSILGFAFERAGKLLADGMKRMHANEVLPLLKRLATSDDGYGVRDQFLRSLGQVLDKARLAGLVVDLAAAARASGESLSRNRRRLAAVADSIARAIVDNPAVLDEGMFALAVSLAQMLEATDPLAASLVYRAVLDAILQGRYSKHYRDGAALWPRLLEIGVCVDDWKGRETELEYRERIGKEHYRKAAFWREAKWAMAARSAN